jgi:hypothetical protein
MGLSILLIFNQGKCHDAGHEPDRFRHPAVPNTHPMITNITAPLPRLHLMAWRCPSCRKAAWVGCDSLCLVFRSGDHYVFAVGESTTTLTIRLSSAAIGLFKSHGIGADDLARIAARWALCRGMKAVTLELTSKEFTDLYLSVCPYLEEGLAHAA